ncbi:MAG: hypothetical protein JOY66_10030 [Acetobacteraceae bacterium]|nr:hypothetical protein [Acetobacteraceae bacterium]
MKSILAVITLALATLIIEEKARQVAGEAQEALGEAASQAHDATETLSRSIGQQPLTALLIAGVLGYLLGWATKRR